MDRRIFLAALAVPFLLVVQSARATDPVVVDNFNNGVVADTDTLPGFWTTRISGALGSATETGGSLQLTAGGSQYPHGQICSPVLSDFNFFHTPLVIEGTGLNFTSPTNSLNKGIFRLALSSRALLDQAPQPPAPGPGVDDSEYWEDDVLALRIESGNNTHTQYQVALGIKENRPVHNSEYDGYWLFNPINNAPGATRPGPIRSFRLAYSPKFWDLQLVTDTSPTDTTPLTVHYTGGVDQFMANWHDPSDAGPTTGNSGIVLQTQLNNAGGTENATASLDQFTVSALRQSWVGASGANWSDAASWSDATILHVNGDGSTSSVPNFVGANVKFVNAASPTIVTTDHDETLGNILFDSAQSFTVQPGGLGEGVLRMDTRWFANEITVAQGSHTIVSPITLYKDLNVAATTPAAHVTLVGPVVDGSAIGVVALTKTGPGTLEMTNVNLYAVSVLEGTLKFSSHATANDPAGVSVFNTVPVLPVGAKIDLTNNSMVIRDPGESGGPAVRNLINNGYNNAAWDGTAGITSSAAAGDALGVTAIGYAFARDVYGIGGGDTATFAGQTVNGSDMLIKYTYYGDSDMSGDVDQSADLTQYIIGLNSGGSTWYEGDYNYDGVVDQSADLTLYIIGLNGQGGILGGGGLGSVVPEPCMVLMPAAAALLGMARRRRSAVTK